jgi:hypothetical protein
MSDFYYTATSDDEDTSASGTRHRRRRTWSHDDLPSESSTDDDDFTADGCNPVQPCSALSSEIGALLSELLSREGSYLSCLGTAYSGKQHRSTKEK